MKNWTEIVKNITTLTQFGLSLITPLLLCLGICMWVSQRTGVGGWIYIPGFFFGMGGSGMVAYKLYLSVNKRQKKEKKKKSVSTDTYNGGIMRKIFSDVQPAVEKETKKVAASTLIGVILMWIGFAVFHFIFPEKVPFDYTVFLGGIGGGIVAVLNFFLMGLAVQKVAATEDEEMARMRMKASYSRRMLLQIIWIIAVAVAPCFSWSQDFFHFYFRVSASNSEVF